MRLVPFWYTTVYRSVYAGVLVENKASRKNHACPPFYESAATLKPSNGSECDQSKQVEKVQSWPAVGILLPNIERRRSAHASPRKSTKTSKPSPKPKG